MAKCEFCGKDMAFGIKVSHSHRRSNRTWKPNVKRVKAIVDGSPRHVYACTRCPRSGKVTRAVCRSQLPDGKGSREGEIPLPARFIIPALPSGVRVDKNRGAQIYFPHQQMHCGEVEHEIHAYRQKNRRAGRQ